MKNTKLTIKLFLIISLFASSAMADGHMGSGGFTDDGHMGSGGKTCNPQTHTCLFVEDTTTTDKTDDSILGWFEDFFATLIG